MKIEMKYSGGILNLPSRVSDLAAEASKTDLALIVSIWSYGEYFSSFENAIPLLASKLSVSTEDIKCSIAFWAKNGVLKADGIDEFEKKMVTEHSKGTATTYTGAQIAHYVEEEKSINSLFHACSAILGKEFNTNDHNSIIYLKNYFKLSDDCIMFLLAHSVEIGKTGWAHIKSLANDLYEYGIDTYDKMESYFSERKNKRSFEYKVRELFGIGLREFYKSERTIYDKWLDAKIKFDLVNKAHSIATESGKEPSMRYVNGIINKWLASGVTTLKAAEELESKFKKNTTNTSFDADDFFEAALKRSYESMEDDE